MSVPQKHFEALMTVSPNPLVSNPKALELMEYLITKKLVEPELVAAPNPNPTTPEISAAVKANIPKAKRVTDEILLFMKDLEVNHPNYKKVMPEDKIATLNRLTQEQKEVMNAHPIYTSPAVRNAINKLKEDLASFRSAEEPANCHETWKQLTIHYNKIEKAIKDLEIIATFQENAELLVSDDCKYPLFKVIHALASYMASDAFNHTS